LRETLLVTDIGKGNVTVPLLLEIISDSIRHALQAGCLDEPACVYLCSAVNLLGKLDWIEPAPNVGKSSVDTSEAPRFLSDAFREEQGNETDTGS
jgi:hypothetical protein